MDILALSLVKPGMKLIRPVYLDDMALLMGGVVLTERHIERLISFGVQNVAVDPAPDATGEAETGSEAGAAPAEADQAACPSERDLRLGEYYGERLRRLQWLFRKHAGDPWMESVRNSLEAYFLMKISCLPGSGAATR